MNTLTSDGCHHMIDKSEYVTLTVLNARCESKENLSRLVDSKLDIMVSNDHLYNIPKTYAPWERE